jgi:MFS family permease
MPRWSWPLWLRHRTHLPDRHKALGLSILCAFAVLVVAGYVVPWSWTGFVGNRLWDWLELLVLPLSVALSPLLLELRGNWTRTHSVAGLTLAVAFTVVVVGGYVGDWAWTGFRGNTLWNWLHLWLLPLLIPAVVVPSVRVRAMSAVTPVEETEQRNSDAELAVDDAA